MVLSVMFQLMVFILCDNPMSLQARLAIELYDSVRANTPVYIYSLFTVHGFDVHINMKHFKWKHTSSKELEFAEVVLFSIA